MKAGAAKKIIETTGDVQAGPAQPVTLVTSGKVQAGAAMPVQIVDEPYVDAHGIKAGASMPVSLVTSGKVAAGTVIPVYAVGGNIAISAPNGFGYTPPFTIYRNGDTFNVGTFDVADYAPTGKAYYVSTTGSDGNDGLSAGAPLRKISTAIGKADVVVIYVAAGDYGFTNGNGVSTVTKNLSIIATGGRVNLGSWAEGLSYALDTPTNPNTYKVTRSNVGAVYDKANPDSNGDWQKLTAQASAADVEANPGSWYTDNVTLYVRLSDSRAPDANVHAIFSSVLRSLQISGAVTVYLENIDLEGGWGNGCLQVTATAGPNSPTVYAKNCSFKYVGSSSNGVTVQGATAYLQGCTTARNADDGFNYHAAQGVVPIAVEIDCIGRDNGASGDADNGSSIHDAGSMVRVNGQYYRNVGRNVHDIGAGTESWNLGCYAHDSTSAVNDADFTIGSGVGGEMWLDRCVADGDIEAAANAAMYTRRCTVGGANTGAGSFLSY